MDKPDVPFDVFLSHSSADKPWVRKLKATLEAKGLIAWLDEEQIAPGDLLVNAMETGIEASRTAVIVVSPEAVASGWVNEEYSRALALSVDKRRKLRLIPVLLSRAELPGFLKNRAWVDFRDKDSFESNVERLVWGINKEQHPGALRQEPANRLSTESVDQAAAICYRWKSGEIELLLVRSSGRRWIFPKGQIDPREPLWRTAQREAHEEAGVSGKISQQPLTTFRHLKRDLKFQGRELVVAAFLLKVETIYEPREQCREPTWFTPEEAQRALSEDRDFDHSEELKSVVHEACAAINTLH